jgi:hypothetical protein
VLAVASSLDIMSSVSLGEMSSSSPSSAINTWCDMSLSELASTSSVNSSAVVANGLPS